MRNEEIIELIELLEENNLVEAHEKIYEKLTLIREYNETQDKLYNVSQKLDSLRKETTENQE